MRSFLGVYNILYQDLDLPWYLAMTMKCSNEYFVMFLYIDINETCIVALISFLVIVASATRIKASLKLNVVAWMNLLSQLQITKPSAALRYILDPLN